MPPFCSRRIVPLVVTLATVGLAALPARAEPFVYALSGTIYGASLGTGVTTSGTAIPNGTPFTETALFDTSSPNLVNIPGVAIYVPLQAAITLNGVTYQIAPYSASQPFGVGLAIFDQTSPFPAVPEYAVALIGNPILDGAGILGDFTTATPDFTIDNLVTTTFPASGFVGAGIFGGICADPNVSNCGNPYITQINDVEPFPLTAAGQSYSLILPDDEILNYALDDPNTGPAGAGVIVNITTPFTASLTDVPEPGSWLLLAFGLAAFALNRRNRRAPSAFRAAIAALAMAMPSSREAHAEPFLLTLSGAFYTAPNVACFVPGFETSCATTPASISHVVNGVAVSSTSIPNGTPFTETALFDTSSPNLGAMIPGTAFYSPISATLSVSGATFQIAPYSAAVPFGVAVAIFDQTSPFPAVPEYGVALIGNVLVQGSGILADFTDASPNFTVDQLASTVFPGSSYVGTGIFSGSCASNCAIPSPPDQVDNIEPEPLTLDGESYALTLPDNVLLNYDLALDDPNTGDGFGTTVYTPFTASLTDVPEPASFMLLPVGLSAVALVRVARRS